MTLVGLLLALLVGAALGLLGGGGSILTVPVFVYVLGFGAREAIAASLAVVGVTSLFGVLAHLKGGNVNLRLAAIFGPFAMAGTYGGARLSVFVPEAAQLTLFAVVMLFAALFMLRNGGEAGASDGSSGHDARGTLAAASLPLGYIAVEGLAVGALTGLVGVGGGFLIIPALVLLGDVPMKQAVGTSLLIIAMKSATGFAGYLGHVEVPWTFLALFTPAAVAGILAGSFAARFVSHARLEKAFAVFLIATGVFIVGENVLGLAQGH